MRWEPTKYGCERLVDDDGRILAEVEDSFTAGETTALIRHKGHIGSFNTRENAKKAVERHLSAPPAPLGDEG